MPTPLDIIATIFGPIYGNPCWNVKSGIGSSITLEFGIPYINVHEPLSAIEGASEHRNRYRTRRHVYITGEWRLWLRECEWQVFTGDRLIGDSDPKGFTKDRIIPAVDELDGQELMRVVIDPQHGTSLFEFDLGSRLETRPYDDSVSAQWDDSESEQWTVFEPSGDVFTYRADGRYKHQPADTRLGNEVWQEFDLSGPESV